MGSPWVIASSAFLFIPALIALLRQSIVVAIVLFNAAMFSTLYHVNDQQAYAEMDVVWASLTVLISLTMLALLAARYPPWNWRIILPFLLGVAGIIVYFVGGQYHDSAEMEADNENNHYDLWHSLWHFLVGTAVLLIVWTPVDLSEASMSYAELSRKIQRNFTKPKPKPNTNTNYRN